MKPHTIYYPKMIQQQKSPESVCRVVMLRNSRYKLNVRTNGDNELYDMKSDPTELHNLYNEDSYQGLVNELQKEMLTWMIHTSDTVPREGHE